MAAAPRLRGRQAALEQLAEKQLAAGVGGGGGFLSPPGPAGGGGGFSGSFGAAASSASPGPGGGIIGLALERSTFAERVADVKDNVERARQDYRNKTTQALGSRPTEGKSAVTAAMHSKFADLEAMWGEVMDYTKIDPWSSATPGVKAAASGLARNKVKLDKEVDDIIDDLWDGVSSGKARQMTGAMRDNAMRDALEARGFAGQPLSPSRQAAGGYDSYAPPGAGGFDSSGMGLALQMPTQMSQQQMAPQQMGQQQIVDFAPPPAGAQDFETRRQLEIMRQDILRLEEQVLLAVEAEEAELPPPPPLVQKHPSGMKSLQAACDYEDMVYRIQTSACGSEGDCGGTLCNSIDDPNMPLIMPPKGGMNVRKQIEALQKEAQELKEATVHEFGGPAARARMADMQRDMKKSIRTKRTH